MRSLCVILLLAACTRHSDRYCGPDRPCPAGEVCDLDGTLPGSDGLGHVCVPSPFDAGFVDAGGPDAGCVPMTTRACGTDEGECVAGEQLCLPDGTWGPCEGAVEPAAEQCNGLDDDCDGPADEDFGNLGAPCTNGQGACAATGNLICSGDGVATVCDAVPGTPTSETCNDLDDDCDGAVDNGCPAMPVARFPWNGYTTGSFHAVGMPFGMVDPLKPTFRWESVPGATSYQFQLEDDCATPGFDACAFPTPYWDTTTPFTTWSPAPGYLDNRRWFWRVRACNAIGCSDWTPVRYVDVGAMPNDIDADGYADIVIGAPFDDQGGSDEGNAFVYYGSSTNVATAFSLRLDNPLNQPDGRFGSAIALLGDVNGDGYADIAVGAPNQDFGAANEGVVYVYHGASSGLLFVPELVLDNPDNEAGGLFGIDVAAAGDVNGDGFADLLVGASGQGGSTQGRAYLHFGSSTGLSPTPDVVFAAPDDQPAARFATVAGVGDLDGDGYADFAIGAPFHDGTTTDEGAVYLYRGAPLGPTITPWIVLEQPTHQAGAYFGLPIRGGDVNGDGFSDVIVSAMTTDGSSIDQGQVYVYLGSPAGPSTSPSVTLGAPGEQTNAYFGTALSVADFDADGYWDLAVGASGQSDGAMNEGVVFVYMSTAAGPPTSPSLTLDSPLNQSGAYFGGALGASDLDGDGYHDLASAAAFLDNPTVNEGSAYVYLGASAGLPGSATLILDSPDNQLGSQFGAAVSGN